MSFDEISIVINGVLCILSFMLAAISVITVIVSLTQNGKLIKMSSEQLYEMRKDRELSMQPVLAFSKPVFVVERPRLFYTPPDKQYSVTSRFRFLIETENISSAVAINIVCTGIIVHGDENEFLRKPASDRISILGDRNEKMDFLFLERKRGIVFDSLREDNVQLLPQVQLEVVFMNTSGGAFRIAKRYLVYPGEDELNKIRTWHSVVSSAEVTYKEKLKLLRENKDDALFTKLKAEVEKAVGVEKEIAIDCVELDDYFTYESIPVEEYNKIVKECHFSRFVGREGKCLQNC